MSEKAIDESVRSISTGTVLVMSEFDGKPAKSKKKLEKKSSVEPAIYPTFEVGNDWETGENESGNIRKDVERNSKRSSICKRKSVLGGVSGQVSSGQVMAIMGPSGAGKTTFLNLLTLQAFGGTCTGSVQLDGQDMSMDVFKKHCAIVEQHDTLWPIMTTQEHLEYAAKFILADDTLVERETKIAELLACLSLVTCAETRASKLSGGQKRRLSLALAMLKSPTILFLDEPTSGLDAASSFRVINALKDLSWTANVAILCTIHQPSTRCFSAFSHIALLSKGQLAYLGLNGRDVISYFEEAGYPLPPNTNPAEYLLDCISVDKENDSRAVEKQVEAWRLKTEEEDEDMIDWSRLIKNQGNTKGRPDSTRRLSEVLTLLKRTALLSIRDPQMYIGRMAFYFLAICLIAIVYLEARSRSLEFAVDRVIQMGWMFAIPSLLTVVHVYQSCIEFDIMSHETRLGFYRPSSFVLARALVELPCMILLALSAIGVGGFAISNLNPDTFWNMLVMFASMLLSFEAIAEACSTIFNDTTLNMLLFVIVWFGAFLFSEIWVAEEDVTLPFRLLFYVSPFRLSLRAFVFLDFHATFFSCGSGLSLFKAINGGKCEGDYSGDTVLDAIGTFIFPGITSDVNVTWCLGVTLLIAFSMKVVYGTSVVLKANLHSKLHAPQSSRGKATGLFWRYKIGIIASSVAISIIAGVSIWMAKEDDIATVDDCTTALFTLGFDLSDFENYPTFFDNNSTITVAQAGIYTGAADIEEYVRFAIGSSSPYLLSNKMNRADLQFEGYDKERGICSFRQLFLAETVFDTETTNGGHSLSTVMAEIELNLQTLIVDRANIYIDKGYLEFSFGLLNNDQTRKYICSVLSGPCSVQVDGCEARLAALPVAEGPLSHVDGNSFGCRALHAVFAEKNEKHCAHIAFDPVPDSNGQIKCQESGGILPTDLFSASDLTNFKEFKKSVGISVETGFLEL